MADPSTPYAPPEADLAPDSPERNAAIALRTEHIGTEASLKAVGLLYYLFAVPMAVGGVAMLVSEIGPTIAIDQDTGLLLSVSLAGVLFFGVAFGLRKLHAWARWPIGAFTVLGLFNFPIGTVLNAYILYLLLSTKGRRVFTANYKSVIEQTPDVKYRTSPVVMGLLIIILIAIAAAIIVPIVQMA